MTGYETYELYRALKLHFTQDSYDFIKYQGKTNVTVDSFEKRKEKYFFHKLARKHQNHDEMAQFLIANLIKDPNVWVGTLLHDESEEVYTKQQKVLQSLSYIFENDCRVLFENVENPNEVLTTNGDYPILLTKTLRNEIHFETFCILNKILNFVPMWDKKIQDTIRWPEFRKKVIKFTTFLPQDVVKYKLILKKVIGTKND